MQVVIGLGCPYLTDDGVGPRVVRQLLTGDELPGVRLVESHAGGLLLVEELAGADRAVIVDALWDTRRVPGEVLIAGVETVTRNAACGHDCSLAEALAIGRGMGIPLPPDEAIHLVAVVAGDVATFSEQLTPAVQEALTDVCSTVLKLVQERTGYPDGGNHA